jgi:hypothetical protein
MIAALGAVGSGCSSHPPRSTAVAEPSGSRIVRSNSNGVKVFDPSRSDLAAVTSAFNSYNYLPSTCRAVPVSAQSRFATVPAGTSGSVVEVSWAIVTFDRSPRCVVNLAPPPGINPPYTEPLNQVAPWGPDKTATAVFEQTSTTWQENGAQSIPFPCPSSDSGVGQPGPNSAAVPVEVLRAWNMTYATACSKGVYSPFAPRG